MSQADSQSKIRISVSQDHCNEYLMLMVGSGSEPDFHQISLAQARALSLELIKQVYRAELRSKLSKSVPKQSFSFPLQQWHQP